MLLKETKENIIIMFVLNFYSFKRTHIEPAEALDFLAM